MVCFARLICQGHGALENFALTLNSSPPMTKKSYKSLFRKVRASSKSVTIKSMERAASEFKDTVGPFSDIEMVVCAVSLDGTWQRRGMQAITDS